VVGLNKYQVAEKQEMALFKPNPEHARNQIRKTQQLKEDRDAGRSRCH